MKFKIVILLLSVFLASCSSSRYGRIPKAKKKKHTVAVKQFKKNKLNIVELVAVKQAQNLDIEKAQVVLNKPQPINISKKNTTATAPTKFTLATKGVSKKVESIKQILKPDKVEEQATTKEIAKGSWLWYMVVGLVLLLVASILSGLIGYIFYVAGVVAVVLGLLMLLGLI